MISWQLHLYMKSFSCHANKFKKEKRKKKQLHSKKNEIAFRTDNELLSELITAGLWLRYTVKHPETDELNLNRDIYMICCFCWEIYQSSTQKNEIAFLQNCVKREKDCTHCNRKHEPRSALSWAFLTEILTIQKSLDMTRHEVQKAVVATLRRAGFWYILSSKKTHNRIS